MRWPSTLEPIDTMEVPVTPASTHSWARTAATGLEAGSGRMLAMLVAAMMFFNIALSFPGAMMNDSLNQYAEAMSGRFTDWHPPVMAWLWSKLRAVQEGPALLFLLHMAAYWGALGLIADAVRRAGHRKAAVLVALSGAFPPFLFMNAYVIKDVGMAVALLAAIAIVFWHRVQGRTIHVAVGIAAGLLLAYGTLVRTNAVFAVGPLLLYMLAPRSWLRSFRIMLGAAMIALIAIPVSQAVNRTLFQPVERQALHSLFLFDIIGVAVHEGDPTLVRPRATMDLQTLQRCYTPFWWDSFSAWGPCGGTVHRPDTDHATHGDGLASQWLRTIAEHPTAYIKHRLKHFNSELFFAVPLKHLRFTPEHRVGDPHFQPREVFSPANVRFDLVRKNPATWPVTWLAWGFVLLLFLSRRPSTQTVVLARVLVVSAIGYTLAYAVVGVATDFRYHYWSMLATAVATIAVLPYLARGFKRGNPVLSGGCAVVGLVVAIGLVARLTDFRAWVF